MRPIGVYSSNYKENIYVFNKQLNSYEKISKINETSTSKIKEHFCKTVVPAKMRNNRVCSYCNQFDFTCTTTYQSDDRYLKHLVNLEKKINKYILFTEEEYIEYFKLEKDEESIQIDINEFFKIYKSIESIKSVEKYLVDKVRINTEDLFQIEITNYFDQKIKLLSKGSFYIYNINKKIKTNVFSFISNWNIANVDNDLELDLTEEKHFFYKLLCSQLEVKYIKNIDYSFFLKTKLDINSKPLISIGTPLSTFCLECEDKDFPLVSLLVYGRPKVWFVVNQINYNNVTEMIKDISKDPKCSNLKPEIFIAPDIFKKYQIPYKKIIQREGELILLWPRSFYQGYNTGFNISEEVRLRKN